VALLNAKRFSLTKKQAEMDTLSQLFNKGKVNLLLAAAYQQAPSLLAGFAVGFVDIDHFKKFNDVCGHQAGDDAIQIVAEILRSMSRPEDFVGRYGGEEFLFALHHTHREGAFGFAERMRLEIEKRGLLLSPRFNNLALTVSIGVALYKAEFSTYRDQVQAADKAMYLAKNQGRNRVVLFD
jgi:diguanylate cyclase (GGDEF)-like protein